MSTPCFGNYNLVYDDIFSKQKSNAILKTEKNEDLKNYKKPEYT